MERDPNIDWIGGKIHKLSSDVFVFSILSFLYSQFHTYFWDDFLKTVFPLNLIFILPPPPPLLTSLSETFVAHMGFLFVSWSVRPKLHSAYRMCFIVNSNGCWSKQFSSRSWLHTTKEKGWLNRERWRRDFGHNMYLVVAVVSTSSSQTQLGKLTVKPLTFILDRLVWYVRL